jgi:hypothetical protein
MHLLSSGYGLHRSHLSHLAHLFSLSPQYSSSTLAILTAKFHHPSRILSIGVQSSPNRLNRRTEWRKWVVRKFSAGVALGEKKEELDGGEIGGEKEEKAPHVAVLLKEVVSQFEGRQVRSFVDCTLGAAGHASSVSSTSSALQSFIYFYFIFMFIGFKCQNWSSVAKVIRSQSEISSFSLSNHMGPPKCVNYFNLGWCTEPGMVFFFLRTWSHIIVALVFLVSSLHHKPLKYRRVHNTTVHLRPAYLTC